eukprot:EC692140.1.p1 GENE.EC692140.1~~EC692140.1.p1  ORF type:complete len:183 (+),score=31.85 EC692140.1:83-631(+)
MSRHSKNNSTQMWFTYHERQELGLGTQRQRLGRDSLRDFDCCFLCLQPAVRPVCTPYGNLYCKLCLLENLSTQKKRSKREMRKYEAQIAQLESEVKSKDGELEQLRLERFSKLESSVRTRTAEEVSHDSGSSSASQQRLHSSDKRQQELLDRLNGLEEGRGVVFGKESKKLGEGAAELLGAQ